MVVTLDEVKKLHENGELERAKGGYLALIEANPNDLNALEGLCVLYVELGNLDEATRIIEKAIILDPANPNHKLHLANILKAKRLFKEAEKVLLDLTHAFPDFAAAHNNLGTVYFAERNFKEAVNAYQAAIRIQANYIDAYYNLGIALQKLNQFEEAKTVFESILCIIENHAPAQFQLGSLLMLRHQYNDAINYFLKVIVAFPFHVETEINLATCYLHLGKLAEAKLHYLKAHELDENDTQILFNLGVISMQEGEMQAAIDFYTKVVKKDSNLYDAHNNLAFLYLTMRRKADALLHFREALRLQPENKAIQHTIHILTEEKNITSSPTDYIRALFDSYADHFEPHLLKNLHYRVPALFYDTLSAATHLTQNQWDILDLGCGTGLCGEIFKPIARSLTGVDLSSKMLALAEEKKIYDKLIESDVLLFLQEKKSDYDLILAGDVLVYFGDLDAVFAAVAHALTSQGYFIFNAEIDRKEEDYYLTPSGRFAHQKHYLDQLAKKYQFTICKYEEAALRSQDNETVLGHLYVLQKVNTGT